MCLRPPVPQCFCGPACLCACVSLSTFHDHLVWAAVSLVQFCGVKTDQKGLAWLLPLNTHTHRQAHTHTDCRLGARALGGWRLMKGSDWREVAKCTAISVTAKLTRVKTSDTHWDCTFRLLSCLFEWQGVCVCVCVCERVQYISASEAFVNWQMWQYNTRGYWSSIGWRLI